MNIQHLTPKRVYELGREQPQKTGQANQINLVPPQFVDQQAVVGDTVQAYGWNTDGIQSTLACYFQTSRGLPIRDHHREGRIETAGRNIICNCFEVRSPAGKQDAYPLHT